MNSRIKGKRGELEAAKAWAEVVGGTARRGQQFSGGSESPDIVTSCENLHLEVKRCEAGNPYMWMSQAVRDCGGKIPVILHRRNGKDWLLIARLTDAPGLAKEISDAAASVGGQEIPPAVPSEGVPPPCKTDGQPPGVLAIQRGRGPGSDLPAEYPG